MAKYIEKEQLLSHLFSKQDESIDVMLEIAEFPVEQVVSMKAYQQVKWERDTAIQQLKDDYDVGFCEKKNPDLVTMKHGKWVWNPNGMDWGLGAWQCSECCNRNNSLPMNRNINPLAFMGSKFCPNCGAKMDLEEGK